MRVRILLVLDDPTIRKHLRALITRQGHVCRCAPTLEAALEVLRRAPCPIAVVDLDLLGRDPAASARELRNASPRARLIALDSLAESDGAAGTESPFDAVIAKPFFLDPLLAALGGPA